MYSVVLQNDKFLSVFLQEISHQLGDDKSLSEHLKLPIQRINDYQLLLKVRKIPLKYRL